MKQLWSVALLALVSACASSGPQATTPTRVTLGGERFDITQLTAGTWTATAAGGTAVNGRSPGKAALLGAIEKTSGCKVTDSDYSRNGLQLDAQVDCPGRLKN